MSCFISTSFRSSVLFYSFCPQLVCLVLLLQPTYCVLPLQLRAFFACLAPSLHTSALVSCSVPTAHILCSTSTVQSFLCMSCSISIPSALVSCSAPTAHILCSTSTVLWCLVLLLQPTYCVQPLQLRAALRVLLHLYSFSSSVLFYALTAHSFCVLFYSYSPHILFYPYSSELSLRVLLHLYVLQLWCLVLLFFPTAFVSCSTPTAHTFCSTPTVQSFLCVSCSISIPSALVSSSAPTAHILCSTSTAQLFVSSFISTSFGSSVLFYALTAHSFCVLFYSYSPHILFYPCSSELSLRVLLHLYVLQLWYFVLPLQLSFLCLALIIFTSFGSSVLFYSFFCPQVFCLVLPLTVTAHICSSTHTARSSRVLLYTSVEFPCCVLPIQRPVLFYPYRSCYCVLLILPM